MAGDVSASVPDPFVSRGQANRMVLEGMLMELPEFRVTPAGRLVASLEVEHVSLESGVTDPQRIELRMSVLALGVLAERCRSFLQGTPLCVEGSLNQKRWIRDGKVRWGRTELLARDIRPLER